MREPDPSEPGLIELPTATSSASPIDAEFAEWYSLYPRKVARGRALKAYRAARKSVSAEVLFDAVRAQREKLVKDGEQFCPHPATWLNTERWTDAAAPSRPVASGPPRFDEIEQPPSGLSPAEYATWERGVRERRQRGAAS